VRNEIERVLSEWEDKCQDLDDQLREATIAKSAAVNKQHELLKEFNRANKESRLAKQKCSDKDDEIKILQERYED